MTKTSQFEIPCPCGKLVRSHQRETVCPQCGAILVVEWEAPPKADSSPAPLDLAKSHRI